LNFINQISIWLSFQLSIVFTLGLPFTLLLWAFKKRNKAILKLLTNYWQISILFFISLILFIGKQDNALLVLNLSFFLMVITVWFWTDINSELNEYKLWNPIALTTKIWRWALTFISLNFLIQSFNHFSCLKSINLSLCKTWLEPTENLYKYIKNIFNFIFGANFSEPVAKFFGLFFLLIYFIGLLQWIIIKLPKTGRTSCFYDSYGN
tara:strand:- start:1 stop:624 length:624 start_codon:yes stop_codon:yes gene_type:complete